MEKSSTPNKLKKPLHILNNMLLKSRVKMRFLIYDLEATQLNLILLENMIIAKDVTEVLSNF